ncbi:GntR family transcriptional regulator [Nonomuraea aridisoli]|uniref:GntR family transcriptional regulator n=1 Tax=Nonomuraea aridisoli TaxID=2070368 RepID=A0A2W2E0I8_9ACTN|nr:GntR family transcriptional regulator [Nonomuraea aridisoli]PZG15841.1 GntR family transcriptional regulator [Nonomuraea aridisoli]
MRVVISNSSGVPIYEQIKRQVVAAILAGDLPPGSPLPSLRALARDLRVSIITTTRAYNDLAQEGYIANVQGKGSFVLPRSPELVREQLLREVEEALSAALSRARTAGLTRDELVEMLDQLLELPKEA